MLGFSQSVQTFIIILNPIEIVGSVGNSSKMPCKTWGISANRCKTGGKLAKIKNSICSACYALRGNYQFASVKSSHEVRLQKFNESVEKDGGQSWIAAMKQIIRDDKYFRFFDSGDLQSEKMLDIICQLAREVPTCKIWLPTKELQLVSKYIYKGNKIPKNLIIRLSAFKFEDAGPVSMAKKLKVHVSGASKTVFTCVAPNQDNNCGSCRKCWDKRVMSVVYKRH